MDLRTNNTQPSKAIRFSAFLLMSFMGFGYYFVYDLPGTLQEKIISDISISTVQYSLLYSLYSWPNVIFCFFNGYLTDKVFGARWGAIIFCTVILIGQWVIALGAFLNIFWLMTLGRFVFGIGGESLAVAQNAYTVSWFKGKNLNVVFGFQASFSLIGYVGLSIVILIASLTCAFSLISTIVLAIIDNKMPRQSDHTRMIDPNVKIRITDVKNFPLNFWILSLICVMYYSTVFPFVGLAQVYLRRKYHLDEIDANMVNSCVYMVATFISPLCGFLVDRTGRNIMWISSGTILTCIAHFIIAFTNLSPWFCTILIGIGYSILGSASWPMVSLIIDDRQLSTAYGMMAAIENLSLGLATMIAGWTVDYKGYIMLENIFLMSLSVTLFLVLICIFFDATRDGYVLNMSAKERTRIEKEKLLLANEESRL